MTEGGMPLTEEQAKAFLAEVYTPEGVGIYWESRNLNPNGRTMRELCAEGGVGWTKACDRIMMLIDGAW